MSETPSDPSHAAFDHAWNWFEYHANQRMTMIRFYLTVAGAIAAGIGYLWKNNEFMFCAGLSAFGAMASISFIRLDYRVSHLVKLGEGALKVGQKKFASSSENAELEICKLADETTAQSGQRLYAYPYTYGENIRLLLGSATIAFAAICLAAIVSSYQVDGDY